MSTFQTDDIYMKAEAYVELINDMQARLFEFGNENPGCINDEIREINRQLSEARMEARINVDEEHFTKWEDLLLAADAAMIKSKLL